jgi:serine/threonine-protein kinase BUR1
MLTGRPILTGESDMHQLEITFDLVGTPTNENMPGWRQISQMTASLEPAERRGNLNERFRE